MPLFFSLAALLLCAIQIDATPQTDQERLLDSADEILESVSRIRGLEALQPIQKGIRSKEQIRGYLLGRIEKEYPMEEIRAEEKALKKLGLIPRSLDLYEFTVELLTEQIAGYYDPYTGSFYIADWIPLEVQKPIMAHELTHALQDQHFDLKPLLKRTPGNEDQTLAHSALLEGEGFIVMMDYFLEALGKTTRDLPNFLEFNESQMSLMNAQFKTFAQAPTYLQKTLLFPYLYGANFVQEFLKAHTWKDVGRIYTDLPLSTEQILHPQKYFGDRDEPTPVEPAVAPEDSGNWRPIYRNVLGEYATRLLLEQFVEQRQAQSAAEGWDGDSLALFVDPGRKECLVLRSVWDSEQDAREFFEAYSKLIEKRYPDAALKESRPRTDSDTPPVLEWEDAGNSIRIELQGRSVEILEMEKAG